MFSHFTFMLHSQIRKPIWRWFKMNCKAVRFMIRICINHWVTASLWMEPKVRTLTLNGIKGGYQRLWDAEEMMLPSRSTAIIHNWSKVAQTTRIKLQLILIVMALQAYLLEATLLIITKQQAGLSMVLQRHVAGISMDWPSCANGLLFWHLVLTIHRRLLVQPEDIHPELMKTDISMSQETRFWDSCWYLNVGIYWYNSTTD
jgi:hypothetical protein